MHKRILSTIVAASVVLSIGTTALATPSQEQLNQSKTNLSQAEQKVQDLNTQIQKLDSQIETTMRQKNDIDNQITKIQKNIKNVQASITDTQNKISTEQKLYSDRIRAMYMNGKNEGYLGILLDSKSFGELISNVEAIKRITDYDKNLVSNLNDAKAKVESEKQKLSDQKTKLVSLNAENAKKISDLQTNKAKAVALSNQAEDEVAKNKSVFDKLQAQADAEKKTLLAQATTASTSTSTFVSHDRGGITVTNAANVIQFAAQFADKVPYVYGGTSPSPGFDCSGFVQYCYARFGVNLPRTTGEQVHVGTTVSSLQPGDLLFFGSASAPYHVAMYVGNNMMIEAPRTGEDVHITPVRGYSIAKRVN
ncbi:C40 family peptidase [Clostridium hydrogenum]|uniref:C40 family peptidase n=1 Tax=Clostridium hydrogenum TaxID=2855764 RepID=UPI002E320DFF|nr:NlpC/P60 family protein [Clostridium hydrogenum]